MIKLVYHQTLISGKTSTIKHYNSVNRTCKNVLTKRVKCVKKTCKNVKASLSPTMRNNVKCKEICTANKTKH